MFQIKTLNVSNRNTRWQKMTKKDLINEEKVVIYTYQMKRDVKKRKRNSINISK